VPLWDQRLSFRTLAARATTLRSEIGKIELDRTFEERTNINIQVVNELDKASESGA
jgi:regulator of protease activity HflC (stomatin/prohibitin superfamily)